MLDVLDLLSVMWGLLEGLDDEGGGKGHHRYLSLTVLDGQLHGGLQTLGRHCWMFRLGKIERFLCR